MDLTVMSYNLIISSQIQGKIRKFVSSMNDSIITDAIS